MDNFDEAKAEAVPSPESASENEPSHVEGSTTTPSSSPQGALLDPEEPDASHGMPAEDGAAQIALSHDTEDATEHQAKSSDADLIYVDYATSATLRYSETMLFYLTLSEAIAAWLALPNDVKRIASITTNEIGGARYEGWEIYRLWGHWNS